MLLYIIVICLLLVVWIWYHPESMLIPLNLLYNIDPSSRTNFYSESEKYNIFPASAELELVWQDIRSECNFLYESNSNINYLDNYNINIGNETKLHWTTIPLRLFGHDFPKFMEHCPITSSILHHHPEIKSCIFSIMDPGKIILPHVGPYDGLLRYQLALEIPDIRHNLVSTPNLRSKNHEMVPDYSFNEIKSSISTCEIQPNFVSTPDLLSTRDILAPLELELSDIPHQPFLLPITQNHDYNDLFPISGDVNIDSPNIRYHDKFSDSNEGLDESIQSLIIDKDRIGVKNLPVGENECYLHVGGEKYEWTEGHGVLFDEANLHGAVNTTCHRRVVMLIDIERPYSLPPFRLLNKIVVWGMGVITAIIS